MTVTKTVEDRILEILFELSAVPVEEIQKTSHLREDLGLDSVASMELIAMLDEEWDIDVSLDEAMEVDTVGGVFELADKYLNV